jgi:hypothetical protein
MNISATFKALCLPSKVYFVLAFVGILVSIFSPSMFGGNVSLIVHFIHLVYVLFWAWVLNLICNAGHKWLSWVLVLAPYVLMFLVITMAMSSGDGLNHAEKHAGERVIILGNI